MDASSSSNGGGHLHPVGVGGWGRGWYGGCGGCVERGGRCERSSIGEGVAGVVSEYELR